jgi:hypothetical protein
MDEPSFATEIPVTESSSPIETPVASPPVEPLDQSIGTEPLAATAPDEVSMTPELSPMMNDRIEETLEKVAWEAFSDLSDTIVRQVLKKVESVAWEVIPQMAESLIREEIRRLKEEAD